ncbi:MAG: DUF4124 domain-containing protein [Myxococcota bacterium]
MIAPARRVLALLGLVVVCVGPRGAARADAYVWVDDDGVTHLTNDPRDVPQDARDDADDAPPDRVRALWDDGVVGPPLDTPAAAGGGDDARITRLLAGARADILRGEHARATAALRSLVRLDPGRPEPYWYLAELERQRGRYASAQEQLAEFVGRATAPRYAKWRDAARDRIASLADEQRLADPDAERAPLALVARESSHFRVELDSELDVRPAYGPTVLHYLEEARGDVAEALGVVPSEPLGVVFYGSAAYQRAHRHRFSFKTVGFFDGRIHVASPADPGESLRALLFHEYTHALFREQTGADRPYWLNEGLAELVERRARRLPTSTRSERAALRARIEGDAWIPLRRIAPSFGGLAGDDARAAYLEAIVTAEWIEAHTEAPQRARLLQRLGEGWSIDQALHEALGVDTDGLDASVRRRITDEFPALVP